MGVSLLYGVFFAMPQKLRDLAMFQGDKLRHLARFQVTLPRAVPNLKSHSLRSLKNQELEGEDVPTWDGICYF